MDKRSILLTSPSEAESPSPLIRRSPSLSFPNNNCIMYITIENVPYEWASWQTKGIKYVGDIFNANGDFLGHNEISE